MSELNFKINKAKFLNALQISAKAVSPNSPVPSLCGIRINADDSGLTLTSSDADISIEMTLSNTDDEKLGLSVITPGTVVIDARYLLEIVKKIDTDEINVEIIDGTLTRFSGGKAEFKINGYRAADYPTMDFSRPAVSFTLKYRELAALISETVFAASAKETRPVLTGVNFANKVQNSSAHPPILTAWPEKSSMWMPSRLPSLFRPRASVKPGPSSPMKMMWKSR